MVTVGSTTVSDLRQGLPPDPKKIVGGFLAMTTCAIAGEFDTTIGVGLAVAIAGSSFIKYGLPTILGTSNAQTFGLSGVPSPHATSIAAQSAGDKGIAQRVPVFSQILQTTGGK
jgi:hypothetical protein